MKLTTTLQSYKASHCCPAKGQEYEHYYQNDVWQQYLWSREQAALEQVLTQHFAGRSINLLDFACGTGRIASFLESKVYTTTGVDVSESMLRVARQKLTRTNLVLGDITESDLLGGRRFNLITAFRFFANAEPQLRLRAMSCLAQLLTDDGMIIFNNHQNAWAPYPLVAYFRQCLNVQGPNAYRVLSPLGMRRLCRRAGLEPIASYGLGIFHLPLINPSIRVNQVAEIVGRHLPPLRLLAQDIVMVCRRRT